MTKKQEQEDDIGQFALKSFSFPPKTGSKFVAFYADGSGAAIFSRDKKGGYFMAEGEQVSDVDWFFDAGFNEYGYLPDSFVTWAETK